MKKPLTLLMSNGLIATFSVVACFLAVTSTNAAPLISARITQIIQDVKLLPSNAAPRPAAVNDDVHQGTAVRTGQDSRTELTFTDKTLTRLGANSVFSFDSGAGIFNLGQGSILMQVPPNGSSVKVKTAAVTAAITGGTAIFGSGPPVKFMVLEGTGTFYPNGHPGEAMTLHGGEMATFTADGHMVGPTTFNVKMVLETSGLIVPFDDLANLPLIYDVISQQQGTGPQIAFTNQTQTFDETDQAQNALPTPAPSGPPSKFGALATISSPNPYVITSGTQINTDPTITTNGVTDQGKIYRGVADDGSPANYFFASTSAFDNASGFDGIITGGPIHTPLAVFKFQSLQLAGDPTIKLGNAGPVDLALIAIDGISSSGPGGPLTFSGIDHLLLATQAGSINLDSNIAFSGIGHLVFYARGTGSNLTLASPISGGALVHLFAEGTVQVNGDISVTNDFTSFSGGDFLVGTGVITANSIDIESLANVNIDGATLTSETLNISGAGDVNIAQGKSLVTLNAISISLSASHDLNWSGQTSDETATNSDGNVTISAGNAINILNDLDIKRTNGGRTSGLNITLNAGAGLTVGGNLSLSTDASNIQNGGNITVTSGGNTTIGGSFILHTFGLAGTATGTGGNIAVHTGGNLLAGDLDFTVNYNTPDVSVNNGANLTLNVGGNLTTTQGGVAMIIYTPIAGTLTNGGNLSLSVGGDLNTAEGGNVNLTVVNTISTTVPNGANLFASIGGNLNANAVNVQIENDLSGGIGTGGNLTFNVAGDLNASSLLVQLSNTAGGHIANGGNITFHVGGDLTTGGNANFLLLNGGGTIGSNAAVDITANSIFVGGSLNAYIDNAGGSMEGSTLRLETSGGITVGGRLNVLGTVLADGDVNVGTLSVTNLDTQGNNTIVGAGGITRFSIPGQLPPDILHTLTTRLLSSAGGINFDGVAANGDLSPATNAGALTINALTLSFGPEGNIANGVTFNGGDGSSTFGAGNGGTFTVNATSDITVDSDIEATSGRVDPGFGKPSGAGGTVNLNSINGTVSVDSRIEVSSDDFQPEQTPPPAIRQSAAGGNINITSTKTTGVAINIGSAAQLLSLLDAAAPGPGGNITIRAGIPPEGNTNGVTAGISGDTSSINIDNGEGQIVADRGRVDITHYGDSGIINISNANIRADVIKITAFGVNGTLNIGGGTISADTMLKLYAAGSNGSINFVANVTLNSQSTATLIQAVSVTIFNGVIVTIAGPAAAEVFTDHPNYSSTDTSGNPTGGNDSTTGKFSGSGANTFPFSGATPPPSKFGPPSVITAPDPYVIGSGTAIQTDPTITTNGHTDYGKIWRGPDTDGPLSAFIFGSTSSFDTASGFDTVVGGNGSGAGFKFTALQLTGDPTVSTTNGEINLGLIAVNGITSGAPGGVLTFAGIRGLLLATQDGPITLGSEISFSGLHDINIYARGSSSDLTLGSDISTSRRVFLLAERDMSVTSNITTEKLSAKSGRDITLGDPAIIHAEMITLSAGQNLTWNGQTSDETALNTDGDVNISAGNQISITNALEIDRRFGGSSTGLNVSFDAGTDLTAGNGLAILVDNSVSGNLDSGANITLNAGNNLTVNGAGGLSLTIANNNGGQIGTGGNISVTTEGDLVATTGGIAFAIHNTGGNIANGGNITLMTGGLSSAQALNLVVENYDFSANPPGQIGTGGNISVTTAGNLTANSISALINNRAGGAINSGGNLTFSVGGAFVTQSDAGFIIETRYDDFTSGSTVGSMIGSNVALAINAGSVDIGGSLQDDVFFGTPFSGISNRGSTIDGNATYSWNVSGNMTIQGDANMEILNDRIGTPTGGTIHGNATIQVNAANLTAGSLVVFIDNRSGGVIDSNAAISFSLAGNLTSPSSASFEILNQRNSFGTTGGTIGSDATINVSAANISIGGFLESFINTNGGGLIQGNAINTVNVSGDLTAHDGIDFEIDDTIFGGSAGGHIGGNAIVTLNGQNITTSSTNSGNPGTDRMAIEASIYTNASGTVGGSAIVNVSALQNISAPGSVLFWVANGNYNERGGGKIGGDAQVNVSAASISTGDLFFQIFNYGGASIGANGTLNMNANTLSVNGSLNALLDNTGGSIGEGAKINFNLSGNLTTSGDASFTIDNSNGGTIGSDATITLNAANISTGGSLSAYISNSFGGNIGGNAAINVNTTSISTGSAISAQIFNDGGKIAGNAIISFNSTGNVTTNDFDFFDIHNAGGSIAADGNIFVSIGGNYTSGRIEALIDNNNGTIGSAGNITFNVGGNMSSPTDAFFNIYNTNGGVIESPPAIHVSANNIDIATGLFAWIDDSTNGALLTGTTGTVTIHSNGTINAGGYIDVLGTVSAGGNITTGLLQSTNVTTPASIIVGSGGIQRFHQPFTNQVPNVLHTLTATAVRSQGGINFNGIPSDNNTLPGTNGGQLTINATSLFIDNLEGDIRGPVTFNGGNGGVNPSNQFLDAGSGGIFNVNTPGRILVNTDIEATSGYINPSAPPSGNGGAVNLNSQSDFVSVNRRIQVSSADPTPVPSATPTPRRVSAKGGNINITSGKTTGVAINIGSSAQLLSLLNAAAPGPGGSIKIVATKAGSNGTNSSSININNANGAIVADRGTVEIRHDGDGGAININNANIRADIVKVGALGLNGTLNIGGGSISADTILKLYATGSNGQLNFISNVTLSSGTAMHLAANTITIQPSIIVTISGSGGPANVYTNHPNYAGFGGTTASNGTFAGNGAHNPQPLANAPGF